MALSIQGTGICQNIPYCEIYLPNEHRKSSELFHYFAEWIAFRFLYSEKGSLAKIDGMDNGDALLLTFLIESERGFVVMQGCIHRIPDARQVACIHIFHRQRILSMR